MSKETPIDKVGGRAFPNRGDTGDGYNYDGMTLLDYFAGQATDTEIEYYRCRAEVKFGKETRIVIQPTYQRSPSKARYLFAQAMITEKRLMEKNDGI
jgi:hypothetical protein